MDKTVFKKKSKQGAIISLIGFSLMFITTNYSIYELRKTNNELVLKKNKLEENKKIISNLEIESIKTKNTIDSLKVIVRNIDSLQLVIKSLEKKKNLNEVTELKTKQTLSIIPKKENLKLPSTRIFKHNELYGLIIKLDTILNPKFNKIEEYIYKSKKFYIINKGKEWGCIDEKGKVKIACKQKSKEIIKRILMVMINSKKIKSFGL